MTEPAKGSSADTNEKDPLLDKDMAKEFFSSWKSLSLAGDDPMDFCFEPLANNKKKAFKFEKLDMGFDLGGDFGDLSSFKVVMPDFDFSSPSKKTSKIKEGSEDKSTGNSKKDQFSFSFDFNELDGFDLDSSMPKKGSETSKESIDCEGAVSIRKGGDMDGLDFDSFLGGNAQATSMGKEDITAVDWVKTENQHFKTEFIADNPRSKQAALGSKKSAEVETSQSRGTSNSKADAICLGPEPLNTSPEKTVCTLIEEKDEQSLTRERTSPASHASETAQFILHSHYADRNDLHVESGSYIHEASRVGAKEDCTRGPDQNAHDKMVSVMESRQEKTGSNASSRLCIAVEDIGEQKEMGADTPVVIMDKTKMAQSHLDTANTPTSLSGKGPPDSSTEQNVQIQNANSKLSLAPSDRAPKFRNMKATEETQDEPIRSRFFKRTDGTESDATQPRPARQEFLSASREREGLNLHPANGRSAEDPQPGGQSGSYLKPLCVVSRNEHFIKESEKSVANTSRNWNRLMTSAMETGAIHVDSSKLQDKSINKAKSVLQRSDTGSSTQDETSSPTKKTVKLLASGTESSNTTKISSLERFKLGKIMPVMPKAKTVRTIQPNKDPSGSALCQEVSCSINKEQNVEVQAKKSSEIHHLFVRNEIKMLQPSTLKRKAPGEDPNLGYSPLKSLKRVSMSPSESRNLEESSCRAAEEKLCSQESRLENAAKSLTQDSPTTSLEALQQISLKELEIPSVVEKDGNVEKAEAYTKELENICSILRKKHEEAKELLVRAVVNNNNLLMLNHPVYEEKIRMVQKFAAKLTSKELPTRLHTTVA